MSNNDPSPPTRRNVLKSIGTAAGVTGLTGVVSASTSETQFGQSERRRVLQSNKVSQIHKELKRPEVLSAEKIVAKVGEESATVYRFQTHLGELRRIDYQQHTVAQFIFATLEQESGSRLQTHSSRQQSDSSAFSSQSIPDTVKETYGKAFQVTASIYTDTEGGITYIRAATEREAVAIESVTGFDRDDAVMGYSDAYEGFVAKRQADGEQIDTLVVKPEGSIRSASGEISFEQATVEQSEVSTSDCEEKACYECGFSAFAGIVTCGALCVLSSPSIGGIVLCIGCAIGAGVVVGVECYQCYETCK